MNSQNVRLKTQGLAQDFDVVGRGPMIDKPCQIGGWWVMPADQYTGSIPPEIQAKWEAFKARKIPVLGYLIADDMRDELARRERKAQIAKAREREQESRQKELELQHRKEAMRQRAQEAMVVGGKILEATGKGLVVFGQVAGVALMALIKVVGAIIQVAVPILLMAVTGIAYLVVMVIQAAFTATAMAFCPVLIAVLPTGEYVCLGAWWD